MHVSVHIYIYIDIYTYVYVFAGILISTHHAAVSASYMRADSGWSREQPRPETEAVRQLDICKS